MGKARDRSECVKTKVKTVDGRDMRRKNAEGGKSNRRSTKRQLNALRAPPQMRQHSIETAAKAIKIGSPTKNCLISIS